MKGRESPTKMIGNIAIDKMTKLELLKELAKQLPHRVWREQQPTFANMDAEELSKLLKFYGRN